MKQNLAPILHLGFGQSVPFKGNVTGLVTLQVRKLTAVCFTIYEYVEQKNWKPTPSAEKQIS